MQIKTLILVPALCAGHAACGDTIGEQAGLGGLAGAGVAAVTDGNVLEGAAIGAAGNVVAYQTDIADCE